VPVLKTIRWEHLAQGLAQGLTQKAAGIRAGYSERSVDATVCKLAKRPDIKARVEELRTSSSEVAAKTVGISRAWVIEGLRQTIEDAKAEKQYPVVRNCYRDIGSELFRMFSERVEVNWLEQYRRVIRDPSTATPEELDAIITENLRASGRTEEEIQEILKRGSLRPEVIDATAEVIETERERQKNVEQQGSGVVAKKEKSKC
jgi:hypothetical protein